jgi:hypothetical protein
MPEPFIRSLVFPSPKRFPDPNRNLQCRDLATSSPQRNVGLGENLIVIRFLSYKQVFLSRKEKNNA